MRRLIAVLAVSAAALLTTVAPVPASASPAAPAVAESVAQPAPVPTAAQLCGYIGYNNVHHVSGYQILFAQYETLTTTYAEARCLLAWPVSGGYLFAGFRARVYSNGSWAGPYGLTWS
jgi:hypothetical protein